MSMTGDFTAAWTPRNKEMARAIVSQNDTHDYYIDTVEITRPDDENYIVDVIVNGKTIYTEKTTTPAFTYTWAQRCKDNPDLTAETKISMYCELNGLESYQKQERTFLWNIPTVAGFAQNETEGAALLKSLDVQDQVVLSAGIYNNVQYIDYMDSPVILLGKLAQDKNESGAMLAADGKYWLPSGEIMTFSDKDTYTVDNMAEGYTLRSWFKEIQLTVEEYFRWNGTDSFVKVNKDGSPT